MLRSAKCPLYRSPWRGLAWTLVLFCAMQASVGLAVSRGWVPVGDPIFADKLALIDQYRAAFGGGQHGKPLAVLALGSSRTLFAVDADRLERVLTAAGHSAVVVNFGMPVAGPIMNNLHLRRLLAAGRRPDLVLIEVLPAYLAAQVEPPMGLWLQPERFRGDEFDRLAAWGWPMPRPEEGSWEQWLAGTHHYRSALLARAAPKWAPRADALAWGSRYWADGHGWANTAVSPVTAEQYRKGLAHAWDQYRAALTGFTIGGPNCAALRDMVAFCRAERLPAMLVLMPEASDFRAWYSGEALNQIDTFLAEVCAAGGCPRIDARTWVADAQFSDGHHLVRGGAWQFTDRLAREYVFPWLSRRPSSGGGVHDRP